MTHPDPTFILPLQDPRALDIDLTGGKGSKLARMLQAGLPVPDGFVVTTAAFRSAIEDSNELRECQTRIPLLDLESATEPESLAARASRELKYMSLSAALDAALRAAFRALGADAVAVRSSAVAEDSAVASFAGQYHTELNVQEETAFIGAIRTCWASSWMRQALHYAMWRGIPVDAVQMAVVVQVMARPHAAGVLFTRAPQHDRDEMLVEAVRGLGEALVSGNATPFEYRLSRPAGAPLKETGTDGLLTPEQLQQLGGLGMRIEKLFSGPQDIEWVLEDEAIAIVQARPTTTRATPKTPSTDGTPLLDGAWSRDLLGEWFRSPITPLFASLALPRLVEKMFSKIESHFHLQLESPNYIVQDGYLYFRADLRRWFWGGVRLPFTLWSGLRTTEQDWRSGFLPSYGDRIERERSSSTLDESDEALLASLTRVADVAADAFAWTILTGAYAFLAEWLLRLWWRLRHPFQSPVSYTILLRDVESTSTQANRSLGALAANMRTDLNADYETIRRDLSGTEFLRGFDGWLARYGHRVNDLDILEPTMQDDPIIVVRILNSARALGKVGPGRRPDATASPRVSRAGWLTKLARRYYAIREDRPFHLHRSWPTLRARALEAGRRLTRRGVIAYANDVVFLDWTEIQVALMSGDSSSLCETVRARRQHWLQARRAKVPEQLNPRWWQRALRGRRRNGEDVGNSELWLGTPGSPGTVTGIARLIRSPRDFACLRPGEIIVAPATTPAWTPLFIHAAGLVTERGGALSHGAIVSREYGIPAVLGIDGLLDDLEDGMTLTVNGDTGEVRRDK